MPDNYTSKEDFKAKEYGSNNAAMSMNIADQAIIGEVINDGTNVPVNCLAPLADYETIPTIKAGFRGDRIDLRAGGKDFYNVIVTLPEGVSLHPHISQKWKIDTGGKTLEELPDLNGTGGNSFYHATPLPMTGRKYVNPDKKGPNDGGFSHKYNTTRRSGTVGVSAKNIYENYIQVTEGDFNITAPDPDNNAFDHTNYMTKRETTSFILNSTYGRLRASNSNGIEVTNKRVFVSGARRYDSINVQQPRPFIPIPSNNNPIAKTIPSTVLTPFNNLMPDVSNLISQVKTAARLAQIAKAAAKII